NLAMKPRSLRWRLPDGRSPIRWLGESNKNIVDILTANSKHAGGISPERLDIIHLLKSSSRPLTQKEIAEELGKNVSTVRSLVRKMADDCEFVRPATEVYTTPTHISVDSVDPASTSMDSVDSASMKSTSMPLGAR